MADDATAQSGHPDMDYSEHDWTYALFVKLLKYLVVVVVLILAFLAYMWG